jgi:hypothetical protein
MAAMKGPLRLTTFADEERRRPGNKRASGQPKDLADIDTLQPGQDD